MVPTTPRRTPGAGGLPLIAAGLGLALVVGGGIVLADQAADPPPGGHTPTPAQAVPQREAPRSKDVPPGVTPAAAPTYEPRRHPARGRPLRLVVPRLGVHAPVVGIDAPNGVLLPPSDPQVLGWWRSGPRPGAARGSALFAGHTVSSGGGALDDLELLRRGDQVRVRTSTGSIRYEVTGVTIYWKARLARRAEAIFSRTVPGRLVVVTCEDWNGSAYLSNVVVVAETVG